MSTCQTRNAALIASGLTLFASTTCYAQAKGEQFDAAKVMKEMKPDQRYAFLAGVVEGLAFARYLKDGKQKAGMECIYDWFYDDKQTVPAIHTAFDRFPTYPPGAIVDVMVKRKCGE